MGQDKAFLPVGGLPCVVRALASLLPLTDDILVVTGDEQQRARLEPLVDFHAPGARLELDIQPGMGVLGGLLTTLRLARHEYCLLVGCDMPFLNSALIRYLFNLTPGHSVVMPFVASRPQPLHAFYHRRCARFVDSELKAGHLKADRLLMQTGARRVEEEEMRRMDPYLLSFSNMNTPQEWRDLARMADGR